MARIDGLLGAADAWYAALIERAVAIEFRYALGSAQAADRWSAVFGAPDDFDIPTHGDASPIFDLTTADGRAAHREWCEAWIQTTPLARRLAERAGDRRVPDLPPTDAPIRSI